MQPAEWRKASRSADACLEAAPAVATISPGGDVAGYALVTGHPGIRSSVPVDDTVTLPDTTNLRYLNLPRQGGVDGAAYPAPLLERGGLFCLEASDHFPTISEAVASPNFSEAVASPNFSEAPIRSRSSHVPVIRSASASSLGVIEHARAWAETAVREAVRHRFPPWPHWGFRISGL